MHQHTNRITVVGGGSWLVIRSRPAEIKYTMAGVRKGNITAVVQATGTINPLTTVPVGSFISGTVQFVFADFNTRVHAGQVLDRFEQDHPGTAFALLALPVFWHPASAIPAARLHPASPARTFRCAYDCSARRSSFIPARIHSFGE